MGEFLNDQFYFIEYLSHGIYVNLTIMGLVLFYLVTSKKVFFAFGLDSDLNFEDYYYYYY